MFFWYDNKNYQLFKVYKMTQYKSAPYLELEDYKAPKGIKSIFVTMNDGIKLRVIYWKKNDPMKSNNGTVLLQQGHNEFIEKYYETIQEFIDRGFDVICFDWRGQGLSDRMIKDTNKQYIEDFKIHNNDLKFIIENLIIKKFSRPLVGIGHSMGGCILLSFLKENQEIFNKVILSSPMLGFKGEKFLLPFIDFANLLFPKDSYMLGSKPNMGKETSFEENDLTTDRNRYSRTQKLVRKNKNVRLWGITNAWAKAVKNTLNEMQKKDWADSINDEILFVNSLGDRVVNSKHITKMANKLKNSKVINFHSCEHEVFMEQDKYRKKLWEEIDIFLS